VLVLACDARAKGNIEMTRRQYRNPPIKEALCEFRFVGSKWAFGTPAKIYDNLRVEYPEEPASVLQAGIQFGVDPASESAFQVPVGRVRFSTTAGDSLVMVGHDLLSIHALPNYPGWEEFRRRIEVALAAYVSAAEPVGVQRVGVRYVNEIRLAQPMVELLDYLTLPPQLPDLASLTVRNFFMRIECESADTPMRLVETLGSAQAEEGEVAFVLDLDTNREWPMSEPLLIREALSAAEELRDFERDVFEELITDKLRATFDA
jgi:uncharacterized protein (TIGR04255 family)